MQAVKGDLTKQQVTATVNPTNTFLSLLRQVSSHIASAVGHAFQQMRDDFWKGPARWTEHSVRGQLCSHDLQLDVDCCASTSYMQLVLHTAVSLLAALDVQALAGLHSEGSAVYMHHFPLVHARLLQDWRL